MPPESPGQQDERQRGDQATSLTRERDQAWVKRQEKGQQQGGEWFDALPKQVREEQDQGTSRQGRDEARQKA